MSKQGYKELMEENRLKDKVILFFMRKLGMAMCEFDPVTLPRDQRIAIEQRTNTVVVTKEYK